MITIIISIINSKKKNHVKRVVHNEYKREKNY